ncbi:MAG: hypothetical protein JNN16_03745 [Nitrospira sp.]|nr:hypothetical protein [Nitrospira sp.]
MKATILCLITLCAALVLLDACTASTPAHPTASFGVQRTSQMHSSDRMFYWHEESRELHAMAVHREREAELVLKKQPGSETDEFAKQMKFFAHQLHELATYAELQAKEAEGEIDLDPSQ